MNHELGWKKIWVVCYQAERGNNRWYPASHILFSCRQDAEKWLSEHRESKYRIFRYFAEPGRGPRGKG